MNRHNITEATQQVFKCFVIMPFSETRHVRVGREHVITETQWNHIFEHWIKKAVESFSSQRFRCVRSAAAPGNFIKGIVRDLYDSDIVIADLTGSKPNVYYELGIRHALDTGTIMVTQSLESVPSDLRGYYRFQYDYASEHHEYERMYGEFERHLHEKIAYIFDNLNPSDNPVSDFLGHPNEHLRHSFEQEKAELLFISNLFRDVVRHNFELCEALLKVKSTGELPDDCVAMVFDFYPFDLLLSRVVNTRWEVMPMQTIQTLNNALQTMRIMFLPVHQGWQILRINPTSEANEEFFELVEAVVAGRVDNERDVLDNFVKAVSEMDFSVTFRPRAEVLKEKNGGKS